jgi:hypothetical protein
MRRGQIIFQGLALGIFDLPINANEILQGGLDRCQVLIYFLNGWPVEEFPHDLAAVSPADNP